MSCKGPLEPCPASTDGFGVVIDSSFIFKTLCDFYLLESGVLHPDNELIVGVEVGGDFFGQGRTAAVNFEPFVGRYNKLFPRRLMIL